MTLISSKHTHTHIAHTRTRPTWEIVRVWLIEYEITYSLEPYLKDDKWFDLRREWKNVIEERINGVELCLAFNSSMTVQLVAQHFDSSWVIAYQNAKYFRKPCSRRRLLSIDRNANADIHSFFRFIFPEIIRYDMVKLIRVFILSFDRPRLNGFVSSQIYAIYATDKQQRNWIGSKMVTI